MTAPIILFTYNRARHTKEVIKALKRNSLSKESDLIIYSDGYKSDQDKTKVKELRKYLKTINGFKNIKIIHREDNLGLVESIITGVTEVINQYGTAIILEDDIIVSPYYLEYMNEALEKYKDEDKVQSITGYCYPIKEELPENFFLRLFSCQAWGTWKRAWDLFDEDINKLYPLVKDKKRYDINNSYPFYKMLKAKVNGKLNSWAVNFNTVSFINNKLNLYPKKSLVTNIGFDSSGTNCTSSNWLQSDLYDKKIEVIDLEVKEDEDSFNKLKRFFNSMRMIRIKGRILKEIGRLKK